ncbi:MAG: CRISPR-associated endonuclease Cas2 [Vicinamibacterales bacterium]
MQAHLFLIAYDVASPKRWRRVQPIIKGLCRRSQLSVFLCRATKPRVERLERELRLVLHAHEDRLMILDLGIARPGATSVMALNPMSDIAELKAAIL